MTNIQPALLPESGFFRVKIELAYDGTQFNGYAKQIKGEGLRTVQNDLESALSMICHSPILTVVAGRTDAGVHAAQQFVHADIPNDPYNGKSWEIENWPYLLNRILRDDVRVIKVEKAAPYFHARFSAIERSYEYKIADNLQYIPPLKRLDVASWFRPLDEKKMNDACSEFIGEFDFYSFCKFREGSSTIRVLRRFEWVRDKSGYLTAFITADAFCYNMVRNLVGAAVCIGEGRFEKSWMLDLLNNHRRPSESYSFPARGLTLTSIVYPPDEELLSRAQRTIARRDEQRQRDDE